MKSGNGQRCLGDMYTADCRGTDKMRSPAFMSATALIPRRPSSNSAGRTLGPLIPELLAHSSRVAACISPNRELEAHAQESTLCCTNEKLRLGGDKITRKLGADELRNNIS
jgi:hypothetical protein